MKALERCGGKVWVPMENQLIKAHDTMVLILNALKFINRNGNAGDMTPISPDFAKGNITRGI